MKKVLLVIIDALASRIALPALQQGRLPCLASLVERGTLRDECVSIFPSITPAATASIVTGVYPCNHQIAGAFWYNREEDYVAYYGDDVWVMLQEGMNEFVNDFLVHLNHDCLQARTLYQRTERHGLTAAAINHLWFRGETRHEVHAPALLKMIPGVEFAPSVMGPQVLALADFAASKIPGRDETLHAQGGMARRYGFHDDTTSEYLNHLATSDEFPDFTLAYFPNNDFESHSEGPAEALSSVENVDRALHQFIEARGGLDRFLDEFAIVVTGDHAQCDLTADSRQRGINLVEALQDFQLATTGQPWREADDVMVCPNMRACHIYVQDRAPQARDRVVEQLLSDPRVDQIMWRESSWDDRQGRDSVDPRSDTFHVETAKRGRLKFSHAGDGQESGGDVYGTRWSWEGDLATVGAELSSDNQLRYGEYPNALERISTGFCNVAADLWVTAAEGFEFYMPATSIHGGGSHAALNRTDSIVPLIVAGAPQEVKIPIHARTIDVAPLCLEILGLGEESADLLENRIAGVPQYES